MSGKRVVTSEGGIALLSVISVLVLLTLVATPFLLTQRDSQARGEKFLYSGRANAEAASLFALVGAELTRSIEHVERQRLDQAEASALEMDEEGNRVVPGDATPMSDALDELTLSQQLDRFNRLVASEHRVWDVDVIDAQSLFNLNNCSIPVLANILGRTELTDAIQSDDDTLNVADASNFPPDGGVVRVGTEVVQYEQVVGNQLVGCKRGYMGGKPTNGSAQEWEKGDWVVLESVVQLAIRPFLARRGTWVRYTNLYQARAVSENGVTALTPEQFDRLRPFVTVWNGNAVGDGWSNPQLIRNNLNAGSTGGIVVQVKNVRYFGAGTVVKITDGVNADYGVVAKVRGNEEVVVMADVQHEYTADQARIYSQSRSPINVNTATFDTLVHVFNGLRLRGTSTGITLTKAQELAKFLLEFENTDLGIKRGRFRDWRDLTNALDAAKQDKMLDADSYQAVLLNAMNANDSRLASSTVPFVFRSYDIYHVRATASILDPSGRELARRTLDRVFEAGTSRTGTFVVETQDDFQRQIMKSRDGKWFATFPDNINGYYDDLNIPASEYPAFAQKARFPNTDRSRAVGDVKLLPAAIRFRGRTDRVFHFDDSDIPEGLELEESPFSVNVDGPYSTADKNVDLVDFVVIEGRGDEVELGMKEFALSFWYRPRWTRDGSDHTIFDYGYEEPGMNRVYLRYDGTRDLLVLGCCDVTREQRPAEVFYDFDHTTWEADQWYHIAVAVHGCRGDLLELFIDGEKQGRASGITRLTANIAPTGDVTSIQVEDTTSFPDYGVLLLQAVEGVELMEYSSKGDTSFNITRRKARTISHVNQDNEPRTHESGDVVQLYGFSAPLYTDVKRGGATLLSEIGPWRAYRFEYEGDILQVDLGDGPVDFHSGLALATSAPPDGYIGITLSEWDYGSTDTNILDDLGPPGTTGLALICSDSPANSFGNSAISSPSSTNAAGEAHSNLVGGAELVTFEVVSTNEITIRNREVETRHTQPTRNQDGLPRFIPAYSYGETGTGTPNIAGAQFENAEFPGFQTAFIPVAIFAQGGTSEDGYLDPEDEEVQLGPAGSRFAYIQIDGEWIRYDTIDTQTFQGATAFYRDTRFVAVMNLLRANIGLQNKQPNESPSQGQGGGSGGIGSATEPARAVEVNNEQDAPEEPGTNPENTASQPPTVTALEIAQNLGFRGFELRDVAQQEFRIANTIPAEHQGGAQIVPCFAVVPGTDLERDINANRPPAATAGFDDLITFRDLNGADEQVRVQWGFHEKRNVGTGQTVQTIDLGWAALTQAPTQTWNWDRPGVESSIYLRYLTMRRFESRAWTRAVKFPSGEMPDYQLTREIRVMDFGKAFDAQGSGADPATLDELIFYEFDRAEPEEVADFALLGEVPGEVLNPPAAGTSGTGVAPEVQFTGIDDKTDEFRVHQWKFDEGLQDVVVTMDGATFPPDGGIIKINDELILYSDFDNSSWTFSGCLRGVFGTLPQKHPYRSRVMPVFSFPVSRLTSPADVSAASFQIEDTTEFPDDGYLRIADGAEIVGYTEWETGQLSGPLGRIDPTTLRDPDDADARVGGGLFRGRFGTVAESYQNGDVVVGMPFRHYDRYAERSDDPENSYVQLSWNKTGAVWKRISWDQQPVEFVEVLALVRFSGGPEWDADRVIRVGQESMPEQDRRKFLYMITDPGAENLLNVESDRCEVRLMVRFTQGAYDRLAQVAPDYWKESPWIKRVVVEYVAAPTVLSQE